MKLMIKELERLQIPITIEESRKIYKNIKTKVTLRNFF